VYTQRVLSAAFHACAATVCDRCFSSKSLSNAFIIPPHSLSYEPRGGTHVQTSRRREFREPRRTQRFNQQTRRARPPALSSRGGGGSGNHGPPQNGIRGACFFRRAG